MAMTFVAHAQYDSHLYLSSANLDFDDLTVAALALPIRNGSSYFPTK